MSDLIHEKLGKVQEGSKEKTFLEKVKASLSSVKNVSQLVSLIITTAQQLGITIEQLIALFR
jgi:ribosomal protein L11